MIELKDKILRNVLKPTRYTGGELNEIIKDISKIDIRFSMCFPDTYEIGMSHLGIKILYDILNKRPDTWCERAFLPYSDMQDKLKEYKLPLFSTESKTSLKEFDFVGFTLQYELSYVNILKMMELSDITLLSRDRKEEEPIICAGGPCAYNPEPLADFVDFFCMGEGEELLNEIMDIYKQYKNKSKKEFLEAICNLEGIYVPVFYEAIYENETYMGLKSINKNAKNIINKRIIQNLNTVVYPSNFIVPLGEIVHDRAVLEIFRGCMRGCRFCQAGYTYRPLREKSVDTLIDSANKIIENTGFEELSLVSLSTSDYSEFSELLKTLLEITNIQKVNLSLPSLRVDSITEELLKATSEIRKSGLTIAPEAGTQRLRDVINKNITEKEILKACKLAFENGFTKIKLYFMIGLPSETEEDIIGISDLVYRIIDEYKTITIIKKTKPLNITVSTSTFVPKPFTPFQWCGQDSDEQIHEKQKILKIKLKNKNITYNWQDTEPSMLEAVIARGNREIGSILLDAYKTNKYNIPENLIKQNQKEKSTEENLPWDHINIFVDKKFLIREYENAKQIKTTPNCKENCSRCGITKLKGR